LIEIRVVQQFSSQTVNDPSDLALIEEVQRQIVSCSSTLNLPGGPASGAIGGLGKWPGKIGCCVRLAEMLHMSPTSP
jgi:hypothetical protein